MKNTTLKIKIKSTFSGILILLTGVLFSCENKQEDIGSIEEEENLPSQTINDVELLYSTNGNLDFQLNAPVLNQYQGEKPYTEMPEGVHIKIFDSLMNVTSELTANYAVDLKYAEKMEAKEDVVVVNDKGEQLNTEHLVWDKENQKITSDVFVKITTKNEILTGEGLVSNQDFTDYRILNPKGIINIDNE